VYTDSSLLSLKYKAFGPQAIVPQTELIRLITYSTHFDDAALPHVFHVSSGIGPVGLSLMMGGADIVDTISVFFAAQDDETMMMTRTTMESWWAAMWNSG
jgi:hypothetical protein